MRLCLVACVFLLADSQVLSSTINVGVQNDNITWLPVIDYTVSESQKISIALSKSTHEEECYYQTPQDQDAIIDGMEISSIVKAYGSSDFVECGIVIGPINEFLLGSWALCGRRTEDGIKRVRCQPAMINLNASYQILERQQTIQPKYEYVVNFGMIFKPIVRGTGTVQSCHVITPNGEDLVVTAESDYPGITLDRVSDRTACSLAIGPIGEGMLGDWTLYGIFDSFTGLNEAHKPMLLYLYDNNDPYSQAYNVTTPAPINRTVYLGSTIEVEVAYSDRYLKDSCFFETPYGRVYSNENSTSQEQVTFVNDDSQTTCTISIGPITADMVGDWMLVGKFSNDQQFNEVRQAFHMMEEDPYNPAEDIERTIDLLSAKRFETELCANLRVTIPAHDSFTKHESCHLRTPNGAQYKLMPGLTLPGVKIINKPNIACGVVVKVVSKESIGDWMLIARETALSTPSERRLPFTIYVEETVAAIPATVVIAQGNDLHIRLANPITPLMTATCRLSGPSDVAPTWTYRLDETYVESCGYIVPNIATTDDGEWAITFGQSVIYRATTQVTVIPIPAYQIRNLVFSKDRPVDELIGPEDTVYCRVEAPNGFVVFEGFGRCRIVLEKARRDHTGTWKMTVGLPGRVLTNDHTFMVTVNEAAPKTVVTTYVQAEKPTITLSCSVSTASKVQACKFREPNGRLLLANSGIGEDRYTFHGAGVNLETNVNNHECGLRISDLQTTDLGLWRCAVETEEDTYYGFLTVLCPHAMSVPAVAAMVVSEPVLTANKPAVTAVSGNSAVMTCSVQSAIRYCYFRARNGTVFNVSPDEPEGSLEYVGAGLDAGECGVRFSALQLGDNGQWSCHVGFPDSAEPEQRASFSVEVEEAISGQQTVEDNVLMIHARVNNGRQLEYCRFVRMDGLGFTQDHLPDGYVSYSALNEGYCRLHIPNPNILEVHPWTVVARIVGQDVELTARTSGSFGDFLPSDSSSSSAVWIVVIVVAVVALFLCILLVPKKNREWTCCRASALRRGFRNSFRSSLHKAPLQDNANTNNTAMAA